MSTFRCTVSSKAVVHRAQPDGSYLIEGTPWKRNLITYKGLNRIVNRAVQGTGTTPAVYLGVGTITAAVSLQSVNFGEVTNGRKVSIVTGRLAQSREWFFMNATWAGNTDSLTGGHRAPIQRRSSMLLLRAVVLCSTS